MDHSGICSPSMAYTSLHARDIPDHPGTVCELPTLSVHRRQGKHRDQATMCVETHPDEPNFYLQDIFDCSNNERKRALDKIDNWIQDAEDGVIFLKRLRGVFE